MFVICVLVVDEFMRFYDLDFVRGFVFAFLLFPAAGKFSLFFVV